jgi:zinc transport system substrate-binding protein
MARAVSGGKCDVRLLLPPGTEAHSFEPRPDDLIRINRSAIFIYTNSIMEPWAEKLTGGRGGNTVVVNAGAAISLMPAAEAGDEQHGDTGHTHGSGKDPHVWLDPANAAIMLDTICAVFVARDPANGEFYRANAAAYRQKLMEIDARYRVVLGDCHSRILLHGGHYAFGYLAKRYGLTYVAAIGVNADAEPTPVKIVSLVKQIRTLGIRAIFAEEMLSPRIAETIASETGARVLTLHAGHTVSRTDLNNGITLPEIMERNLHALSKGLECRQ